MQSCVYVYISREGVHNIHQILIGVRDSKKVRNPCSEEVYFVLQLKHRSVKVRFTDSLFLFCVYGCTCPVFYPDPDMCI